MSRRRDVHKDSIESVLDKIGIVREELVAIEQSLERIRGAQSNTMRKTATTSHTSDFKAAERKREIAGVARLRRPRTSE
jgi:hypothetical protein